jgi:mycofactocin precursor
VNQITPGGTVPETTQDETRTETPAATEEVLVEDSLVEEVSIDGMCGVY